MTRKAQESNDLGVVSTTCSRHKKNDTRRIPYSINDSQSFSKQVEWADLNLYIQRRLMMCTSRFRHKLKRLIQVVTLYYICFKVKFLNNPIWRLGHVVGSLGTMMFNLTFVNIEGNVKDPLLFKIFSLLLCTSLFLVLSKCYSQ